MIEIERKFRVTSEAYRLESGKSERITQGYLNSHPERTVRVRIKGQKAFLTIKGKGNTTGTSRFEWEKPIDVTEAMRLLELCEPGIIDKIRWEVYFGNHMIEVDEFLGENAGLVLAEIELKHEKESFEKPYWLGEEVTGDSRFYNAYLSNNSYKNWSHEL